MTLGGRITLFSVIVITPIFDAVILLIVNVYASRLISQLPVKPK